MEQAAQRFLQAALQSGAYVFIVSNSEQTWCAQATAKFLPSVYPLITNVTILSARSLYESYFQDSPVLWKRLTFELIVTALYSGSYLTAAKNILSIGDSKTEREAMLELAAGLHVFEPLSSTFLPAAVLPLRPADDDDDDGSLTAVSRTQSTSNSSLSSSTTGTSCSYPAQSCNSSSPCGSAPTLPSSACANSSAPAANPPSAPPAPPSPPVHVKLLKFVERPLVDQLVMQLDLVSGCLDQLTRYEGLLDIMVSLQQPDKKETNAAVTGESGSNGNTVQTLQQTLLLLQQL